MNKFFALAAFVLGSMVAACTFNTNNEYEIVVPEKAAPSGSASTVPTTPAPSASVPSGTSDCKPTVTLEQTWQNTSLGAGHTTLLSMFTLTASACADVEIKKIWITFIAVHDPSPDAFCASPCNAPEDWNFRNLKLVGEKDETLMGPVASLSGPEVNDQVDAMFSDSFVVRAGEKKLIGLVVDTAYPLVTDLTGRTFQTYVSLIDAPGVIQQSVPKTSEQMAATFSVYN
jgi:hypothetical protein